MIMISYEFTRFYIYTHTLMVEIYSKSLVRAIGKIFHMKLS